MSKWRPQTGEYPACVSWMGMLQRVLDPKHTSFESYGGRGIQVCERWRLSFTAFLKDMGPRLPGCSIERRDTNGNYEPSNCYWATREQQANNRRNNVVLTARGRTQTVATWAKELGVSANALLLRVRAGWVHERIIETPVGWRPPKKYTTKFGAQTARIQRLREQGLCIACGQPAEGKSRCPDCAAKRRKSNPP